MVKGSLATLKESTQLGCVSQDSHPRKSITGRRNIGIEVHRQILQRHLAPNQNSERKGPSRGIIQKCAPHERSPYAPKFRERSHEETSHRERCARSQSGMGFGDKYVQDQESGQNCVFTPIEARVMPGTHFKISRRARLRSRFRSINTHDEQKILKLI